MDRFILVKSCVPTLLLACTLLTMGCQGQDGPQRVAVEGTVALDGKPLPSGMIRFIPGDPTAGPAAAALIKEGRFVTTELDGPIPGQHRVEIDATDYVGFAIDDEAAFATAMKKKSQRLPRNPVPERYNRRSTLTADIAADPEGNRKLTFDLKSSAK
ncbi:MAG: hypothetical protein AB7F89_15190 [Pirellulaceae bacterium]